MFSIAPKLLFPKKRVFSNKNYIICGSITASPNKSDPVNIQNLIWNFLKVTNSQRPCKPMETIEIGSWWVKWSAMKWGSTDLPLEKNVAASLLFSSFLFAFKKAKFCIQLHSPKNMEINIVIFIFSMVCLAYNGKGYFSRCLPRMWCLYVIPTSFYF